MNQQDPWVLDTLRDSTDTLTLRYGLWRKSSSPMKKCIVFLNGRAEWIEKYDYLPNDLGLPEDCGFLTWDHRGQGASGGARSYVDNYDSYASDARRIVEHVLGDEIPYVIISHSMGGLIALYSTLKHQLHPQSLLLSSPFLGMPQKPVHPILAKPVSQVLTQLGLGPMSSGSGNFESAPFAENALTHHYDRFLEIKNSPYPCPTPTFGWVCESIAAQELVMSEAAIAELTASVLIFVPEFERVVSSEAPRQWVQAAFKQNKAVGFEIINHAKHELFSEIPRIYNRVIMKTKSWLGDFLG